MSKELLDHVVSGAIYDFAGFLTTRDKEITLSSHHNAAKIVPLIKEFFTLRGVDQTCEPMIGGWQNRCSLLGISTKSHVSNFDHLPDGFYTIQLTEDSQEKSLVRLYTNPDTGLRGFGYGVWDGGAHLPLFDITDSCIIKPVNLDL